MRHGSLGAVLAALAFVVLAGRAFADDASAIRNRLVQWAEDFNAGRKEAACELFSKTLVSDVAGQSEGDYATRCKLLGRAIDDPARKFRYTPTVREILVEGDIAVVRISWKLEVTPGDITANETGMDIFRKEADGQWRIIRFVSFDVGEVR